MPLQQKKTGLKTGHKGQAPARCARGAPRPSTRRKRTGTSDVGESNALEVKGAFNLES